MVLILYFLHVCICLLKTWPPSIDFSPVFRLYHVFSSIHCLSSHLLHLDFVAQPLMFPNLLLVVFLLHFVFRCRFSTLREPFSSNVLRPHSKPLNLEDKSNKSQWIIFFVIFTWFGWNFEWNTFDGGDAPFWEGEIEKKLQKFRLVFSSTFLSIVNKTTVCFIHLFLLFRFGFVWVHNLQIISFSFSFSFLCYTILRPIFLFKAQPHSRFTISNVCISNFCNKLLWKQSLTLKFSRHFCIVRDFLHLIEGHGRAQIHLLSMYRCGSAFFATNTRQSPERLLRPPFSTIADFQSFHFDSLHRFCHANHIHLHRAQHLEFFHFWMMMFFDPTYHQIFALHQTPFPGCLSRALHTPAGIKSSNQNDFNGVCFSFETFFLKHYGIASVAYLNQCLLLFCKTLWNGYFNVHIMIAVSIAIDSFHTLVAEANLRMRWCTRYNLHFKQKFNQLMLFCFDFRLKDFGNFHSIRTWIVCVS